jgi:hypothetical protein
MQKPKAVTTFEPLIEDDFICSTQELKLKSKDKEETPKEMKRKIKEQEKHAVRELRKDTQVLMIEKKRERMQRDHKFKKQNYTGGNKPKDEI